METEIDRNEHIPEKPFLEHLSGNLCLLGIYQPMLPE